MANDLKTTAEYEQLSAACDFLEHYHCDHTHDMVTRFRGKLKGRRISADIYIVSDPEWKKKFFELVAPIMQIT